jgi:hypothetical protein
MIERLTTVPADRPPYPEAFAQVLPAMPAADAGDDQWLPIARAYRAALESLSPITEARCLPGEAGDCGGTAAEHTLSYGAALVGWALAQLGHQNLNEYGRGLAADMSAARLADIADATGCDHRTDIAAFARALADRLTG